MDKKNYNICFAILGPLSIILSFVFLIHFEWHDHLFMTYSALIALPLCWLFQLRGWIMASILTVALFYYHMNDLPPDIRRIEFGIAVSLLLGYFITALSAKDINNWIMDCIEKRISHEQMVLEIDKELHLCQAEYESTVETYKNKLNLIEEHYSQRKNDEENKHRSLVDELTSCKRLFEQEKLVILQNEERKRELISHLQLNLDEFTREKERLLKELETKTEIAVPVIVKDEAWREARRYEGLYMQLKEQFQVKSQELDAARGEIYAIQEQLLTCQKDQEERFLFERSSLEQSFEKYVINLENIRKQSEERHENEVEALHGIISHLSNI